MVSSGTYNRVLHVLRATETDDGYGNYTSNDFLKVMEVRAQVHEMRGGDVVRAARITGQGSVQVTIRQNPKTRDITAFDRLYCPRFKKTYHIKHIADLTGKGTELSLTCVEYQ